MKSTKGITLIALIITIIVLLILAGVALAALTGQGNIIVDAENAVGKYNNSVIEEQELLNEIEKYFNNYLEGGSQDNPPQEGITSEEIANNPNLYYGEEVDYTPTNGLSVGWKIFYADEENIYLIADDYVPNTYAPNAENGSQVNKGNTDYKIGFFDIISKNTYDVTDIQQEDERVKKWISYININFSVTHRAIDAIAYLLDTSIWTEFKDENNKAEYVVGGPTLEIFIESYNDTHETYLNCEMTDSDSSDPGYHVKWSTESSYDYFRRELAGLDKSESLYINDSTNVNADGYWLASPSGYSYYGYDYTMFCVDYNGCLVSVDIGPYYHDEDYGFRPVVCLKSGTQLIEQTNGKYAIQ